MKLALIAIAGISALALPSCALLDPSMPMIASAQVADDFDTYRIQRVGLMPFQGSNVDLARADELQLAFYSEFSRTTPFELVLLTGADLEEVQASDPHRRGWYHPTTIIEVARRYRLDAILFGTVVREQFFPPQELSTQVDMVAAETGLVIWSSIAHLSANDERVQQGLKLYYDAQTEGQAAWELALVSPTRFARFAAFQIASML